MAVATITPVPSTSRSCCASRLIEIPIGILLLMVGSALIFSFIGAPLGFPIYAAGIATLCHEHERP